MQFLQEVFRFPSRSGLSQVDVDGLQYHTVKQQLDVYQAIRQQKCLPKIDLKIFNDDIETLPRVDAESRAQVSLDKSLLTGE